MSEVLRQRMYHLTMYNISEIQKGIQSYHAGMEYAIHNFNTPEFQQWVNKDKVVIILNGGTSNNMGYDMHSNAEYYGTMEGHVKSLFDNKIEFAAFTEPDLNNATSALAFLVDERVWDREKYPDPIGADLCEPGRSVPNPKTVDELVFKFFAERYGEKTAFLRTWLKQFRLA